MTCEWRGCQRVATEVVVMGLGPVHLVCSTCHEEVRALVLPQPRMLSKVWWPRRNTDHNSRRAVTGRDWRPLC